MDEKPDNVMLLSAIDPAKILMHKTALYASILQEIKEFFADYLVRFSTGFDTGILNVGDKMKALKAFCAALILFLLTIPGGCEREKPGEPIIPIPDTLNDYYLYVWDMNRDKLYQLDIPADTVICSTPTDFYGWDLYPTPDGQKLLLNKAGDNTTEVYSTSDLSHLQSMAQYGEYYFDGRDNYAILNSYEKIYFLNPETLLPTDSIQLGVYEGYLDTINNWFFAYDFNPNVYDSSYPYGTVLKIDCMNHEIADTILMRHPQTGKVMGGRGLCYNSLTDDIYFLSYILNEGAVLAMYNLGKDSLMATIAGFQLSDGHIAISPDRQFIYATEEHDAMGRWPISRPDGKVFVINALNRQKMYEIYPPGCTPPDIWYTPGCFMFFLGKIIPSPDNKRLYIGAGYYAYFGNTIIVDLQGGIYEKRLAFSNYTEYHHIALGPKPSAM